MRTATHTQWRHMAVTFLLHESLSSYASSWCLDAQQGSKRERGIGSLQKEHGSKSLYTQGLGSSSMVKHLTNMPRAWGLTSSNTHTR